MDCEHIPAKKGIRAHDKVGLLSVESIGKPCCGVRITDAGFFIAIPTRAGADGVV